jgi:hypothetical protein
MGKKGVNVFEHAVVKFRIDVVSGVGAGFNFLILSMVAAWRRWRMRSWHLCLMVSGGHVLGRMKERLGEGKWAAFSDAATDGFDEFTGFFRKPSAVGGGV